MLTMLNLARFGVGARVSGAGGNAPPRSRRTGREPLSSYGSRCKTTLRPKLPVSKESRTEIYARATARLAENGVVASCISVSAIG